MAKRLAAGIRQRKDGKYEARFTVSGKLIRRQGFPLLPFPAVSGEKHPIVYPNIRQKRHGSHESG